MSLRHQITCANSMATFNYADKIPVTRRTILMCYGMYCIQAYLREQFSRKITFTMLLSFSLYLMQDACFCKAHLHYCERGGFSGKSVVLVGARVFLGRGLGRIMGYRDSLCSLASLFQSERAQEMLLWVAKNRALLHMWVLSLHD